MYLNLYFIGTPFPSIPANQATLFMPVLITSRFRSVVNTREVSSTSYFLWPLEGAFWLLASQNLWAATSSASCSTHRLLSHADFGLPLSDFLQHVPKTPGRWAQEIEWSIRLGSHFTGCSLGEAQECNNNELAWKSMLSQKPTITKKICSSPSWIVYLWWEVT